LAGVLVDLVVGARPNFVKAAPVYRALRRFRDRLGIRLVHTGQHYDANMSDVFFADLEMPAPDIFLGVGSGAHGAQTAAVMARYEEVILQTRPDLTLVFGDVNSTMACALAAVKQGVAVGHVEAGLRSFDRTMPEEINRVVTDHVADLLFTPSRDADENLRTEGIPAERVHLVGNVMIDSLAAGRRKIDESPILDRLGLTAGGYVLVTMHRPSNVDSDESLGRILAALQAMQPRAAAVFPVHPRTRARLASPALQHLVAGLTRLQLLDPLPYSDFLRLLSSAALVLTDSGGVQEETTFLGVPCLIARPNTERPVTVEQGTSVLVGNDTATIVREANRIFEHGGKKGSIPPLWDGRTAERIAALLWEYLDKGGALGAAAEFDADSKRGASL
jgi:UDP-N-acetylglucosamine 2-epimerase (non-hydrolysing)